MASPSIKLPSRGVNVEWMGQLELLDVDVYPLPGASVRRGPRDADPRLVIQNPLSTDVITFLEHVASVRHKPSQKIYVAARETMDALLARQRDPDKFPAWLMKNPVKQTELHIHILQAVANPKPLIAQLGKSEEWYHRWLAEIPEDWVHETIAYYLIRNKIIQEKFFDRG